MKRILITCILLQLMSGCTFFMPETSAKVSGNKHAKPIIFALEQYKKSFGSYPESIDALSNSSFGKGLALKESSVYGIVWSIKYERKTNNAYDLWFQDAASDVHYENGIIVYANSNPFR